MKWVSVCLKAAGCTAPGRTMVFPPNPARVLPVIEEGIGSGGMVVVSLAHHLKHDLRVPVPLRATEPEP